MEYLHARTPRSLRYDALRFPGCVRISLTREAFENSDDRIEYWDAGTETAWVVADNYAVHEGTSAKMRAALVEAGASEATAEAAAADLGELAGEVRIIRWMLASLLGVVLTGFGLLGAAVIQILVRLP